MEGYEEKTDNTSISLLTDTFDGLSQYLRHGDSKQVHLTGVIYIVVELAIRLTLLSQWWMHHHARVAAMKEHLVIQLFN